MARSARLLRWAAGLASALSGIPPLAAREGPVLEGALGFFTRHDGAGLVRHLDSLRPPPLPPADRRRTLASLPAEGEVRALDPGHRRKLEAARGVLARHQRDSVYAVKVVDVPQAALALHARAVLIVSRPALDLLDAGEVEALVAHEVGHEYFWDEYHRAREAGDRQRLRTVELLCDGLAIVSLRRAGRPPERLTSALEKMTRFNRGRFGAARNEGDYPDLGQRRRFARRLSAWLEASEGGGERGGR